MTKLRSPLPWMGGKFHLARRILAAFPPHDAYDTYVEPFGGAAHVLLLKPPYKHVEVYNDLNGDLVNFWLQCRDHADALQRRLDSLPYARSLYYDYHRSLFDGTSLPTVERAARWFYVLRSSFLPEVRKTAHGWSSGSTRPGTGRVQTYYHALQFFTALATRFRNIEIDNRDFEHLILRYQSPRTLFYCDPPYIGVERYYSENFTEADHRRLAALLNATPAYVALSYYPHPLLAELYQSPRWRSIRLQTCKHSQRTKKVHDPVQELLLMNYPAGEERLSQIDADAA